MTRAVEAYRVVYFEEPLALPEGAQPALRTSTTAEGVLVATPMLPPGLDAVQADAAQRALLDGLLDELAAPLDVLWFYTPMALGFAGHLRPAVTVFDSMDELSAFKGAPPRLLLLERDLMRRADVVFTGGRSLHEAKRQLHGNVHLFPSSVDAAHFRAARGEFGPTAQPADQVNLPRPRLGFFGVVDERMDLKLVDGIAARRPDCQVVMLGPVAKISPADLPARPNLHWLGMKAYAELPAYLAGWDVALMPFALNEATRFISPTKTPEYLAAGVPVVATPVADVVRDWGQDGLVEIEPDADGFVAAIERLSSRPRAPWLHRVDDRLRTMSWSATWAQMAGLIDAAAAGRPAMAAAPSHASLSAE